MLTGKIKVPFAEMCIRDSLLRADDWDQVATHKRLINDKYIFCYLMGNNPDQRLFV